MGQTDGPAAVVLFSSPRGLAFAANASWAGANSSLLVSDLNKVRVVEIEGTQACVLELVVAPEDVGKVIGKKGIHADAIRRIVHAVGGKNKKRYVLEILEDR
jgi:predicted RNA-binding protein YlqC (UPF0109 family)